MRLTRTRTVVAALAVTLSLATPVLALTSGGASASCGYAQSCSGAAQDVPGLGSSGTDVQVNCNATTPSRVQATIVRCYIRGNTGDVHYTNKILTQGQASVLKHRFSAWGDNLTSRSYILCVGAGYYSTSGALHDVTGYVCNPGV
jgi:hypothetical protein